MIFSAVLTTRCRFSWSNWVQFSETGSDAATQEALYSPSVESGENGRWALQPSQVAEKRRCYFFTVEPVLVFRQVDTEEFGVLHDLHWGAVDVQWLAGPSVLSGSQQPSLWFCLYSETCCWLRTELSVVPPPLCMMIHHSCRWDPQQSHHRQTWKRGLCHVVLCNRGSGVWTAVDWGHSPEVPLYSVWWCWRCYSWSRLSGICQSVYSKQSWRAEIAPSGQVFTCLLAGLEHLTSGLYFCITQQFPAVTFHNKHIH